jgi:hypothetical protein
VHLKINYNVVDRTSTTARCSSFSDSYVEARCCLVIQDRTPKKIIRNIRRHEHIITRVWHSRTQSDCDYRNGARCVSDGKTLTTTTGGKEEKIAVEKLTSSELTLAMDAEGMKMKLMMKKK